MAGMGMGPMGPDPMMGPMPPDPGMGMPMPPMGPDPMMGGAAPMDENAMLMELIQAAMMKWEGGEAQLAGEKGAVIDTLMSIMQGPGALDPAANMVEGGPAGQMGMPVQPEMGPPPPGPMPPPPMM